MRRSRMPSRINDVKLTLPITSPDFNAGAGHRSSVTVLTIDADVAWAQIDGDTLIVAPHRQIWRGNSCQFRTMLFDLIDGHAPRRLLLDFEAVTWMDSSACAVLIEALR